MAVLVGLGVLVAVGVGALVAAGLLGGGVAVGREPKPQARMAISTKTAVTMGASFFMVYGLLSESLF
jgi:hypothetical protein